MSYSYGEAALIFFKRVHRERWGKGSKAVVLFFWNVDYFHTGSLKSTFSKKYFRREAVGHKKDWPVSNSTRGPPLPVLVGAVVAIYLLHPQHHVAVLALTQRDHKLLEFDVEGEAGCVAGAERQERHVATHRGLNADRFDKVLVVLNKTLNLKSIRVHSDKHAILLVYNRTVHFNNMTATTAHW